MAGYAGGFDMENEGVKNDSAVLGYLIHMAPFSPLASESVMFQPSGTRSMTDCTRETGIFYKAQQSNCPCPDALR